MERETKLTVKAYSHKPLAEWKRLTRDAANRLEFDTTMHYLERHLPRRGTVLDAGGGPGRYSLALAKKGYDVVLLDITPANIEFAKRMIKREGMQSRVSAEVGDITGLRFGDKEFDAVICLGGPLSHVHGADRRAAAVSELARVAKNGAPLFVSVMSNLGTEPLGPEMWPAEIAMTKHFRDVVERGEDYMWHQKYYCHFFRLEEFRKLFEGERKLRPVTFVGLQGLSSHASTKALNRLEKAGGAAWANWMRAHFQTCEIPSVVEGSRHMLAICRRV